VTGCLTKRQRPKRYRAIALTIALLTTMTSVVNAEETAAGKEIRVYIDRQFLVALEGGEQKYRFDVVTGRDGKETTAGNYEIFRKHEKYVSKAYGAEMPYTMFFSADGKAIHGTQMAPLRSYLKTFGADDVGSMGCVGLTDDNAKALFEWAPTGTRIVVIRGEDNDEAKTDAGKE
jgi:lipoprotein-anchoring transpeptidase ErfK/SrfK